MGREGCVIRLAGLYDAKRGPHTYWLRNGTVQGAADVYINMLHYEDAAGAAVAALEKGLCAQPTSLESLVVTCSAYLLPS